MFYSTLSYWAVSYFSQYSHRWAYIALLSCFNGSWWKEEDNVLFDIHWELRQVTERICCFKIDLMAFQRSNNHVCLRNSCLPLMNEGVRALYLYLACIFSSSAVAGTDHVCCDVSVKRLTAVTPRSWNNGHCYRPQCEGGLTPTWTVVAPPRHPTHQAFDHSCPLLGQRCQRHIFIQHHGRLQLNRKPNKKDIQNY